MTKSSDAQLCLTFQETFHVQMDQSSYIRDNETNDYTQNQIGIIKMEK